MQEKKKNTNSNINKYFHFLSFWSSKEKKLLELTKLELY